MLRGDAIRRCRERAFLLVVYVLAILARVEYFDELFNPFRAARNE
jgi:hypothetical protein